ncbi:chemotaxis protein MotB [Parasphingorhabdus marina DSM 22363]|uniref:Chemotaxis protein MotB n=1 Tax=Parasphingorhabdus marina DSM 22363 TaxID=1123272 RepID=A0A1N6CW64_9SPHN|nr:flagellar motor protein MotB [Parasphingorhabdus marina]SIN62717.1 chemotaxis protein MotB [Parasphingorhabdus marina DSM 22363]
MAAKGKQNEPPPQPIIVKKIIEEGHGGHHGGAWKVAYADFVTAMMAFFLMMWLLGATDEKQRKALADYFTPTLVEMKQASAGSNGMFGGDSLTSKDNYPSKASQTGTRSITIPRDSTGTNDRGGKDDIDRDRERFEQLKRQLKERLERSEEGAKLYKNLRFVETQDGLRIDLVDQADFSMFMLATDILTPKAERLIREIGNAVVDMPNDIIVRGHTDSLPYASGKTMNNWKLSAARAEATRAALIRNAVPSGRFSRIEGVADREPFNTSDKYDSRNRRMAVTLEWRKGEQRSLALATQRKPAP